MCALMSVPMCLCCDKGLAEYVRVRVHACVRVCVDERKHLVLMLQDSSPPLCLWTGDNEWR